MTDIKQYAGLLSNIGASILRIVDAIKQEKEIPPERIAQMNQRVLEANELWEGGDVPPTPDSENGEEDTETRTPQGFG